MNNRSGKFKTNLYGEMEYKSFSPNSLPPSEIVMSTELVHTLINANRKIAELESIITRVPNMSLFVYMYVRKEALMSSQIEGTQATLEDVLNPSIEENTNRELNEVINNIKATEFAVQRLNTLPLCSRLIKEVHSILMQGTRGQEKNPGEFRNSQNWIGGQGTTLKNASFIPPNIDDMHASMNELDKYINSHDDIDPLIQAALIHYQFETIHPFLDGNGRVGRLLITLFLIEKKIISSPALYISYYLKANRIEYYDRMSAVRNKGTYEQWIIFFLKAILESADDAINTIDELDLLHNKNVKSINKLGRSSSNVLRVFKYLETNPIIDIKNTSQKLNLAFNTTTKAIKHLIELGILIKTNEVKRNRVFIYSDYLEILKKGT